MCVRLIRQEPLRVRVVAEQFAWNFHYPGADGEFGETRPELVNLATNPLGIDKTGPGEDDVSATELHLPVDRAVVCEILSKDVIHSFFLPVMRVKQDAIPGMRIPVWFEPVKEGVYEIACAQLCGNNHYSMKALMTIHDTDAEFEAWLETRGRVVDRCRQVLSDLRVHGHPDFTMLSVAMRELRALQVPLASPLTAARAAVADAEEAAD